MLYQLRFFLFTLVAAQSIPQYKKNWYTDAVVPMPASWLPSYFKYGFYQRIGRSHASNSLKNLKTARSNLDKINEQSVKTGNKNKTIYMYAKEQDRPKRTMFLCDFSRLTAQSILSILRYGKVCGFYKAEMRFGLGRR